MELIEHWWNSKPADTGRQDVFVRRNPAGQYEVEHRAAGRSTLREYPTGVDASAIARALRVGDDSWRDLTAM